MKSLLTLTVYSTSKSHQYYIKMLSRISLLLLISAIYRLFLHEQLKVLFLIFLFSIYLPTVYVLYKSYIIFCNISQTVLLLSSQHGFYIIQNKTLNPSHGLQCSACSFLSQISFSPPPSTLATLIFVNFMCSILPLTDIVSRDINTRQSMIERN